LPKKALFLIDGVHKPDNTIYSAKALCRKHKVSPAAFVWIGGTEKIKDRQSFSREFEHEFGACVRFPETPVRGIKETLAGNPKIKTVIQLSGAPQIFRERVLEFSNLAAGFGVEYIAGGTVFREHRPPRVKHKKPSVGIYATDKRAGKTAFGSYIGRLASGMTGVKNPYKSIIITHSRGGPADPPLIEIYKKPIHKPAGELTLKELLSSRFKPEYLSRLVDFGLHGASDVFEDALILSTYLDLKNGKNGDVLHISLIGCRRAGAGYFNEFAVSNADKGIRKANKSPANLIIHEGSGAEHPPVEVDAVILLVPSDTDTEFLKNFPGLEKAGLFIITNCQKETVSPEKVRGLREFLKTKNQNAPAVFTRFIPEIVHNSPQAEGKKVAFFTTAPGYILDNLSEYLEKKYKLKVLAGYGNLASDEEMKKSIDEAAQNTECFLFEIKARGVEGAKYVEKKYGISYYYLNNIPQTVDEDFKPSRDNSVLDEHIMKVINYAAGKFNKES
jgi:predicted GTPase